MVLSVDAHRFRSSSACDRSFLMPSMFIRSSTLFNPSGALWTSSKVLGLSLISVMFSTICRAMAMVSAAFRNLIFAVDGAVPSGAVILLEDFIPITSKQDKRAKQAKRIGETTSTIARGTSHRQR